MDPSDDTTTNNSMDTSKTDVAPATSSEQADSASQYLDTMSEQAEFTPPDPEKRQRQKRTAIIALAAVGVSLLLGGGVYAYVRETPAMIMQDAFYRTSAKSEGLFDIDVSIKNKGQEIGASASGAYLDDKVRSDIVLKSDILPSGKITAHQFSTNGKLYVKVDDVRKQLEAAASAMGASAEQSDQFLSGYQGLLEKVDSKWVVITEQDLEQHFGVKPETSRATTCVENAISEYRQSRDQKREVVEVFKKHQFLTLKKLSDQAINGRSSYHLTGTVDKEKAKTFGEALESTTVYSNIKKCAPEQLKDDATQSDTTTDLTPEVSVWVDKATRTLSKVQIKAVTSPANTNKGEISITVGTDYFSKVTMTEPKADVTLDQLMTDIDAIRSQALGL